MSTSPGTPITLGRSQYQYPSLDDSSTQIRLLRIRPRQEGQDVPSCSLAAYDLETAPPYAAASYTWGSPENEGQILLDGKPMQVRWNCQHLLWQFGLHDAFEHYWVDAICINQEDPAERGSQVAMMWQIFARAQCVLISLAHDIPDFPRLARSVEEMERDLVLQHEAQRGQSGDFDCELHESGLECHSIGTEQLMEDIAAREAYVEVEGRMEPSAWHRWYFAQDEWTRHRLCVAVNQMQSSPYWSRLWIVQEIMAARQLSILCDAHCIHWDAMAVLFMAVIEPVHRYDSFLRAALAQK